MHETTTSLPPATHQGDLARLLSSLFLVSPPTLAPEQVAPNLSTRLRLLALPPVPPRAQDPPDATLPSATLDFLPEAADGLDDPQHDEEQRRRLVEWLVTDLYPSAPEGEGEGGTHDRVATALFAWRRYLRSTSPAVGEEDLVRLLVSRTIPSLSDGATSQRVRIDLHPPPSPAGGEALSLLLSSHLEPGDYEHRQTLRYENMLPTSQLPPPSSSRETHTGAGATTIHFQPVTQEDDGQDEDKAEYIADPDDFWAGFSDDDDDDGANAPRAGTEAEDTAARAAEDDDDYWSSYPAPSGAAEQPNHNAPPPPTDDTLTALRRENEELKTHLRAALDEMRQMRQRTDEVVASLETALRRAA